MSRTKATPRQVLRMEFIALLPGDRTITMEDDNNNEHPCEVVETPKSSSPGPLGRGRSEKESFRESFSRLTETEDELVALGLLSSCSEKEYR